MRNDDQEKNYSLCSSDDLGSALPVNEDPARELFLRHPLGALILKNALPAIASMLFMSLYHMADAVMVGRSLGPEALASVNILYPILAFFIGLAAMIGVGGNARVAVLQGAGKSKQARRVLGLVISLGTGLGIGCSILTIVALSPILTILGTSGSLGELAGQYLVTLYPFFTTMILIFILEQTVRNDGRPNLATGVMVAMAILNIILDYIFLFPLSMGISGAALATGIAQTLGALIFVAYFLYKKIKNKPGLQIGIPGGGFRALRTIAVNGSSELFNSIAGGVTTFLFNRALLSYIGSEGVAAFAMVQYLIMFGTVFFLGISIGSQPILSYNHGAGLTNRVRGTLGRVITVSVIAAGLFFILLRWQAAGMVTMFIPDHPETVAITLRATSMVSWALLIMPIGIISSMFFTALERAGSSLLIALSRGLVFNVIGLALFPVIWGEAGIWITPVFAEIATVIVTVFLLYRWNTDNGRVTDKMLAASMARTE